MKIIKTESGSMEIEWEFKGISKTRVSKNRQGYNVAAQATTITIPSDLVQLISNDNEYTYMYGYFEKAVLTPNEPPKTEKHKKIRLNDTSKSKNGNKRFELPNTFLDTDLMDTAVITYNPNKEDYHTHKKGIFTVKTKGCNERKHLKRKIVSEEQKVIYEIYIRQSNASNDIQFHKDLKNIIHDEFYVYEYEGDIYLSNTIPPVEYFQTTEEDLQDNLFDYNFIKENTDKLEYILYLNQKDIFDEKYPKIQLKSYCWGES